MKKLFTISWPAIARVSCVRLPKQLPPGKVNANAQQNYLPGYINQGDVNHGVKIELNSLSFFIDSATYTVPNTLISKQTYSAECTYVYEQRPDNLLNSGTGSDLTTSGRLQSKATCEKFEIPMVSGFRNYNLVCNSGGFCAINQGADSNLYLALANFRGYMAGAGRSTFGRYDTKVFTLSYQPAEKVKDLNMQG